MIFSILTIIVGYFLGDFILSKNAFGIIFSIIFYLVFFAFALYTLRWTLNLVLKENQHAANPIRFSLLLISVFVPTVLGAILAAVVSLMDNSEILVAGSYVSLILIVIFYLCNIIFIFWGEKLSPYIDKIEKRIAKILKGKRKKDEN
jgi:SNF family Na+-dependent transporter